MTTYSKPIIALNCACDHYSNKCHIAFVYVISGLSNGHNTVMAVWVTNHWAQLICVVYSSYTGLKCHFPGFPRISCTCAPLFGGTAAHSENIRFWPYQRSLFCVRFRCLKYETSYDKRDIESYPCHCGILLGDHSVNLQVIDSQLRVTFWFVLGFAMG